MSERTGAFSYQIPITVPPGRLGMSPSLGLSYSSDRPLVGGVAAGWSMGLPEITRDDSRALESDATWMSPHGRLLQFAEPGTNGSATHYRAWGDDSFTRYTRLADDLWEARATSGIVNKFQRLAGVPVDDRFVLVSSTDRFGNTVRYNWRRVTTAGGLAADQLDTIEYTANDAAGLVAHARVTFVYGAPVLCGDSVTPVGAQLVTTASEALMIHDASPLTTIRTEVRDTPTGAFRPVREAAADLPRTRVHARWCTDHLGATARDCPAAGALAGGGLRPPCPPPRSSTATSSRCR